MTAEIDQGLAMVKEQAGIDVVADVIGALGDRLTYYELPAAAGAAPGTTDMEMPRMVFALELSSPERLQAALPQLLDMSGMFERGEHMGVATWSMGMMGAGGLTIAGRHLVFAMTSDDLHAVIASMGAETTGGLAGSEAFQRAMEGLPAQRMAISYSDPRSALDMIETMLPMMLMSGAGSDLPPWLDLEKLPLDVIRDHMDVAGGVGVRQDDGIFSISLSRMKKAD
jgi:hypothetical protein